VQDSSLQTVGKILDRMAELRTMSQDVTKNTGDIENYSKEFVELQSQLKQIKNETFNGISLFSAGAYSATNDPTMGRADDALADAKSGTDTFHRYGRTLYTHPGGQTNDGSISINVVNLEHVLEVGSLDDSRYSTVWGGTAIGGATGVNLGNVDGATANTYTDGTNGVNADGFVSSILGVSMAQFTNAIEKLADVRAENGAEQNRALQVIDMLQSSLTNLEAAHGRIMDADIALESTRFARHNVLVQAGAAMTAQANQLTNVALSLIG
jgi:flagellin-like hook-associated protein FlgL